MSFSESQKQLSGLENDTFQCETYIKPHQINRMKFDAAFKVIVIGNSGVGKSCILSRMGSNKFSESHEVTIGAGFTTVVAKINLKHYIQMRYWDTCG